MISVVVVGAGPTGLAAACTLAERGVGVRVLDAREGPDEKTRAIVAWSGALEVLDGLGVGDALAAHGLRLSRARYFSAGAQLFTTELRVGESTWTAPLSIPQPRIEEALRRRLGEHGVEVEWGCRVVDVATHDDRVELKYEHRDGTRPATASWVIAADGARSAVRSAVGIRMEGTSFPRDFLLVDGSLRDGVGTELSSSEPAIDEPHYHLTESGVVVVVPLAGGGHRVFLDLPSDPDAPRDEASVVQVVREELASRFAHPPTFEAPRWASRFTVHALVADEFRSGRVLLAGDAAHVHSPAGGQGMNTGIQDGFDVGWRIAALEQGASPALLDGYAPERREAAVRAVRQAELQTKMWLMRGSLRRRVRDLVLRRVIGSRRGSAMAVERLAQVRLPLGGPATLSDPRCPKALPRVGDLVAGPATGRSVLLVGASRTPQEREELARQVPWVEVRASDGVGDCLLWVRPDRRIGGRARWQGRAELLRLLSADAGS